MNLVNDLSNFWLDGVAKFNRGLNKARDNLGSGFNLISRKNENKILASKSLYGVG